MDDQVVGALVNFHFLLGCHVVLALGAVPFVVAAQGLFHAKVIQAVVYGRCI